MDLYSKSLVNLTKEEASTLACHRELSLFKEVLSFFIMSFLVRSKRKKKDFILMTIEVHNLVIGMDTIVGSLLGNLSLTGRVTSPEQFYDEPCQLSLCKNESKKNLSAIGIVMSPLPFQPKQFRGHVGLNAGMFNMLKELLYDTESERMEITLAGKFDPDICTFIVQEFVCLRPLDEYAEARMNQDFELATKLVSLKQHRRRRDFINQLFKDS